MYKTALTGFFLLLTCLVAACGAASTPAPEATSTAPAETGGPPVLPNLLVEAEGDVWLRRVGWTEFLPAGFGIAVQPGDLLRIPEGTVVSVFCGNETLWDAGPKTLPDDGLEHTAPCQTGRPPRPWSDVAALRGEQGGQIPYVLRPRNTALISNQPQLQWHPLPGVNSYTVTLISDDGKERLPVEVGDEQVEWPADWPPLEARATYVLVVEGGGALSDEGNEQHAGLGFWLLSDADAEVVSELESRLRAQPITPTGTALLVAELYLSHQLRAEATELLEGLATSSGVAPVWLALGQTYLEAGLPSETISALDEAVAVAQATGQQDVEAAARVGLALVARLQDDAATADAHLRAARLLYEQVGDQDGLEQVDQLLSE